MKWWDIFLNQISTKCFSSEFFKEEYRREFDKMWKGALQKAGIIDGTAKEKKAPPTIHINDADRDCRDVFSCDVLIKLKVLSSFKILPRFMTTWEI